MIDEWPDDGKARFGMCLACGKAKPVREVYSAEITEFFEVQRRAMCRPCYHERTIEAYADARQRGQPQRGQ